MILWAKIPNFSKYYASTEGEVYSTYSNKVLKGNPSKGGYLQLKIRDDNGVIQNPLIHQLVARTFILNKDNLNEVDHINNNRTDNRAENLNWISHKANTQKARSKSVVLLDESNQVIREFASLKECSTALGITVSKVFRRVSGQVKDGLKLRYKDSLGKELEPDGELHD